MTRKKICYIDRELCNPCNGVKNCHLVEEMKEYLIKEPYPSEVFEAYHSKEEINDFFEKST